MKNVKTVLKHAVFWIVFAMVFFLAGNAVSLQMSGGEKIKLKRSGKDFFSIKKKGDNYKAISPNLDLKVYIKDYGYKFKIGAVEYKVKRKNGKYKIYTSDNVLLYKIKQSSGKIKILKGEDDSSPWSLKLSDDRLSYKVTFGDKKVGKIKYYPDTSVIKVKDYFGEKHVQ